MDQSSLTRVWLGVALCLLAAGAGGGLTGIEAATLEIRVALEHPAVLAMSGYANPSMQPEIQLQAIRRADDGTTEDVTALAAWSSSNPSVGMVTATGLFQGSAPGETLVRASHGGLTSDPARVRIGALNAAPAGSASRVSPTLSVDTATTDPDLESAMQAIIELLVRAGLTRTPLEGARDKSDYHEEGVNAGGAPVSSDGEATTYLPGGGLFGIGISFVDGYIVIVWDGRYHTVFKAGDAGELRIRSFFGPSGTATGGLQRALHEMCHILIRILGVDIGSEDEEMFVSLAERLLTAILEVYHVPGRGDEEFWRNFIKTLFQDLLKKQGGKAFLDGLGIKDLDGDGFPDLIKNAPKVSDVPALHWPAAALLAAGLASYAALALRRRARRAEG